MVESHEMGKDTKKDSLNQKIQIIKFFLIHDLGKNVFIYHQNKLIFLEFHYFFTLPFLATISARLSEERGLPPPAP